MNKRDDRHAPLAGEQKSRPEPFTTYQVVDTRTSPARATPEDEQRFRDLQTTDERLAAELADALTRIGGLSRLLSDTETAQAALASRLALVEARRGWDMPSSTVWLGFFNSLASRKFLLVVGNAVALLGTAFAGGNDWQTYIPNIIAALVSVGYIVIEGWRDANVAKAEGEVAASVAAASVVAGVHTSPSHGQGQGG